LAGRWAIREHRDYLPVPRFARAPVRELLGAPRLASGGNRRASGPFVCGEAKRRGARLPLEGHTDTAEGRGLLGHDTTPLHRRRLDVHA
jgi:hypothetical protein